MSKRETINIPRGRFGAALDWTIQELGGLLVVRSGVVNVGTSSDVVIQAAGDRVAIIIAVIGTNTCYLAFEKQVTPTNGIPMIGAGAIVGLSLRDDFTLAAQAMYIASPSGANTLYVTEYVRSIQAPESV